ncbi:MAG: LiaF-related protein [Gemmatimonadota bacterium]|nr:LiaF-related protein [Gemmatimonadota bacterium]
MRRRTRRLLPAVAGLAAALGLAGPVAAQEPEWTDLRIRRTADRGLDSLRVRVEYAAGRLAIHRAAPDLLYDVRLRYDAREVEPARSWEEDGGVGRLDIRVTPEHGELDDVEFDDEASGRLDLGIGAGVATALRVEAGAAETRLELGGLPLTGLVYRTGASRSEISFDTPNPVRLADLEFAAGAAEFRATGLGNARFDRLTFEGAVGDVTLDFGGAWEGEARADIAMGLGALRLVLPRGVGIEIRHRGLLAGFDPEGLVKNDGVWRTPGFEDASRRLRISVRAAFGKVDVDFTD